MKIIEQVAADPNLAKRVRSMVELPLSFVAIQDRGFHLDMPEALALLMEGMDDDDDPRFCKLIAQRLSGVCRCLGGTIVIRHGKSSLAEGVARDLKEIVGHGAGEGSLTVLIVDRSVDVAACVVHEYTYEALVYDLLDEVLDVDRHVVRLNGSGRPGATKPGPGEKDVLLSESDPLWQRMRHWHLTEVSNQVRVMVETLMKSAAKEGDMDTAALLQKVRSLPEHRDTMARCDLHLELCKMLQRKIESDKLAGPAGMLEQDIATGVDQEGRDVKGTTMISSLSQIFEKGELASGMKLRLLLLYFMSMANVSESARQTLFDAAALSSPDHETVLKLLKTRLMSRESLATSTKHEHRGPPVRTKRHKAIAKDASRKQFNIFEPRLTQLMQAMAKGQLPQNEFPEIGVASVEDGASEGPRFAGGESSGNKRLGNFASDWGTGAPIRAEVQTNKRFLVFIVGGVLPSELREGSACSAGTPHDTEVLVAGTSLLTPWRFIHMLSPQLEESEKRPDPTASTPIGRSFQARNSTFSRRFSAQ